MWARLAWPRPGTSACTLGSALAVGVFASMAIGTGGAAVIGLAWIAAGTLLRPAARSLETAAA